MIELLTQDDINIITAMRQRGSGGGPHDSNWIDTPAWLSYWNNAKDLYLNKIFKDSLILSKEIEYNLSDYEISTKINKELFNSFKAECKIYSTFKDRFKEAFLYLYESGKVNEYWAVLSLMDVDNLASNSFIYSKEYVDIPLPDGEIFRLQNGAKVSKAIGKICKLMNITGWEPVRLKISQILNDSRIKGEISISIHPMDYLSASVNNNRWNSCMNFYEGEYRRGVIEMMNSPCVICAYIKSTSENIKILGHTWNSKKWREFFIVDKNCISGVKGYPYCNQDIETFVLNWLKELIISNNVFPDVTWCDNIIHYEFDGDVAACFDKEKVFLPGPEFDCGPAMYNDFYSGGHYMFFLSSEAVKKECLEIFYSGYSECAICGGDDWSKYYDDDYAAQMIICSDCDHSIVCEDCGDRYPIDDMYEVNGLYFCEYCFNRLPVCDICDKPFTWDVGLTDTEVLAHAVERREENPPIIRKELCLCGDCLAESFKNDTPPPKYYETGWRSHFYITLDELTDETKDILFNTSNDKEIIQQHLENLNFLAL